ncbi:MAG TPA: hypothetical protein VFQ88_07295 [Nevskiaceae bacterium]|nr:hypothetical protein [Nevskiaceae bacterium]
MNDPASPEAPPVRDASRLEPGRFTIVMEGGAVKAVVTRDATLIGEQFSVIDYDCDDVDPTWLVPQHGGAAAQAVGYTSVVESSGIDLDNIVEDDSVTQEVPV